MDCLRHTHHGPRFPGLCLLVLLLLGGCACLSIPKPRPGGPEAAGYHDLVIRARRQIDGRMKGGRVMVKIRERQGMILFLSPLNQVVLKLEVEDGAATLFSPRRKAYWQGAVGDMMAALWDLPLDWNELSTLLLQGRLPPQRPELGELTIRRGQGADWQEAELDGPLGRWQLTVLQRSFRRQALPRRQEYSDWLRLDLAELVNDERPD